MDQTNIKEEEENFTVCENRNSEGVGSNEKEDTTETSNGNDMDAALNDEKCDGNDGDESGTTPQTVDPYAYLNRNEFTSEKFKIEVSELPKYYGFGELRKFFVNKLKLNPHKIIPPRKGCPFIFLNFKSEEERQLAVQKIDGYVWKNKTLSAKLAKPTEDPLLKKRMNEKVDQCETGFMPSETVAETIQRVTTPWWDVPYPDQLERKNGLVAQVFSQMKYGIHEANRELKSMPVMGDDIVEKIKPSPMTKGYRNKCEFTIGFNPETKQKTVGFRLSSYKMGSAAVGPVDTVTHIPECMLQCVLKFQEFVQQSKYDVYDPVTHVGCFRQITIRTTSSNDIMMMVHLKKNQLSADELADLIENFKSTFSADENVKSFYLKNINDFGHSDNNPPELIFGDERITEQLLGLKFAVSPEAFFQINLTATEVLYKTISDLLEEGGKGNATLLDVCSGTGTIGLSVSSKCAEVLGIEMVASAVEDAQRNAEINGLSEKCKFFVGKAEDITEPVIVHAKTEHIVAVVDPPRAGLHQKVLFTLRKCHKIRTLIYVACNAKAAMKNFLDLARPSSKAFRGVPFIPVKLIPVDMFPNSPHFELIIVFKRLEDVIDVGKPEEEN